MGNAYTHDTAKSIDLMFFDARAAKLLAPGDHLLIDGCEGLRLVASVSRKTWVYRYKAADGRMKQTSMGQWPAVAAQSAVSQWQTLRDQRGAGFDPVTQRKAAKSARRPPAVYSVRVLVDDYITGHLAASRKPAGAEAAKRALLNLLDATPDFASLPATEVSRGVAFAVLDGKKATPTAAQKLRSMLASAWDLALDSGALNGDTPNWWRQVMRGKLKSKGKIVGGTHQGRSRRVLQAGEAATLLAWLPNMHVLGRDAVVMYLWTCTRGAEFLAMRREHITQDGAAWWWTVPKAQTKTADVANAVDLRVPLFGQALEAVQRRLASVGASGWLFEDARGEQYTQHDFSTYIYSLQPYSPKVVNRQSTGGLVLPVTHWSPHNLRRTGRTLLASLGCPNEIGEAIVGHVPPGIVGTYNSFSYDPERTAWLKKLSDYLESLVA